MLIFCSSRKGCESTARHVAKYLKRVFFNHLLGQNESIDVTSAIDALRRSPAGLDPVLEETLPAGVAYHHAGLTVMLFKSFVSLVHMLTLTCNMFLQFSRFSCFYFIGGLSFSLILE